MDSLETWLSFRAGERYTEILCRCFECGKKCDGGNTFEDSESGETEYICNLCCTKDDLVGLKDQGKAGDIVAIVKRPVDPDLPGFEADYAFLLKDGTVTDFHHYTKDTPFVDCEVVELV